MKYVTNQPNSERNWLIPALVVLPILGISAWAYKTLQFKDPRLGFVPKNARIQRSYMIVKGENADTSEEIVEMTGFLWDTPYREKLDSLLNAIQALGFHQWRTGGAPLFAHCFRNQKGDQIILQPQWKPTEDQSPESATAVLLTFMHTEQRALTSRIKRAYIQLKRLQHRGTHG